MLRGVRRVRAAQDGEGGIMEELRVLLRAGEEWSRDPSSPAIPEWFREVLVRADEQRRVGTAEGDG